MIQIPILPNSPLASLSEKQGLGAMHLRRNLMSDFVENGAFDSSIIVYDQGYQNSQGYSQFFRNHLAKVISILKEHSSEGAHLVEVGCGKGEFLDLIAIDGYFFPRGYDATYEGCSTFIEKRYLNEDDRVDADIVVLRHVLEHIQRPHEFLKLLKSVFGSKKVYIEVPRFEWILEKSAFFDITYEHVNYFTEKSLASLFGGKTYAAGKIFNDQYQYVVANLADFSDDFSEHYQNTKNWIPLDFDQLFPLIEQKITSIENSSCIDSKVFLWGGATKGCLFLHHCQRLLRLQGQVKLVVDINPGKWGKYMPGSMIPIAGPEKFFETANEDDLLVIANPNYRDEIITQVQNRGLHKLRVIDL
jgi:hypothetical protein